MHNRTSFRALVCVFFAYRHAVCVKRMNEHHLLLSLVLDGTNSADSCSTCKGVLPKQDKRQRTTRLFTAERTSYALLNWVLTSQFTVRVRSMRVCVLNANVQHQQIKRHRHSGE